MKSFTLIIFHNIPFFLYLYFLFRTYGRIVLVFVKPIIQTKKWLPWVLLRLFFVNDTKICPSPFKMAKSDPVRAFKITLENPI